MVARVGAAPLNSTMQQHNHQFTFQGLPEPKKRQCSQPAAGTPPTKRTNRASGPNGEVQSQCIPVRKFMDQPTEDTPVLAVMTVFSNQKHGYMKQLE